MRREFDEWYVREFGRQPHPSGYETDVAWRAWQAARAQSGQGAEPADGQWLIQMRGDYLTTRGVWERPDHRGYTNDIHEAGRYSEADAKEAERMMPDKCKAVRLPTDCTQGGQGAEPIGWVHKKHLKELESGHPIRVYHQDTPVVFDSKVPVYTQPQPTQQGSVPDYVNEALQRLIENGGNLGPASREDALVVAQYRRELLTTPKPESDGMANLVEGLAKQAESENISVEVVFDDGYTREEFDTDISEHIANWLRSTKRPQPPKEGSGDEH